MINEIILFRDVHFKGEHTHVYMNKDNLESWNDQPSSLVVMTGNWVIYEHSDYNPSGGYSTVLGPGIYPNLHQIGWGDRISSVAMGKESLTNFMERIAIRGDIEEETPE